MPEAGAEVPQVPGRLLQPRVRYRPVDGAGLPGQVRRVPGVRAPGDQVGDLGQAGAAPAEGGESAGGTGRRLR